jgi:hypothetical protein
MQQEMTPTSGPLGGTTVKYPARVITYAWGEKYVDTLRGPKGWVYARHTDNLRPIPHELLIEITDLCVRVS